ncbi:MAG: hypothetical protein VX438_11360 [Planctomycetota bacterium]|nr:hypothetical protein [Planctomycetota bacterium]
MNLTQENSFEKPETAIVESIVRKVIQRLSSLSFQEEVQVDSRSSSTEFRLEIFDKVVTLESLFGKLDGIRTVAVNSDAIITPAVRDELKALGIELETLFSPGAQETNQRIDFCIARLASHFVPVDWLKNLGRIKVCCGDDYRQLADNLVAESIASKTICFAAQPYVAVSILNRKQDLRVAYGRTEKEVAEIKFTLDANVLVLDAVQPKKEQLGLVRYFVSDQKGVA